MAARVTPLPTPHLLDSMKKRDVTWAEILEICEKPEVVYGPDHRGRKVLQKGDLSVVVTAKGDVITVLLRNEDRWDDTQARNRKKV